MLYSSHIIICTVSCITTGIYNDVHALIFSHYHIYHLMYTYWYIQYCSCFILLTLSYIVCHVYLLVYTIMYMLILLTLSYVQCHVYLFVYTIMYILYSSHPIIYTMSCIPTSIYNNVHALFF